MMATSTIVPLHSGRLAAGASIIGAPTRARVNWLLVTDCAISFAAGVMLGALGVLWLIWEFW